MTFLSQFFLNFEVGKRFCIYGVMTMKPSHSMCNKLVDYCIMGQQIYIDLQGVFKMPAIGLGTWQSTDEKQLENALNAALEMGYRHIDTAYVYGNEAVIGRVINKWCSESKLSREELFITTKLPTQGVHEDRVEIFLNKSLENLQMDYVDLYLIHFPICTKYLQGDPPIPPGKLEPEATDHKAVWKKMEVQVAAGRAKAIGLSNFNMEQIQDLLKTCRIKPACLQVELHVYLQQRDLVKFCHKNKIAMVAYSPLGSPGFNKFLENLGLEPKKLPDVMNDETITEIARKYNKTNAQVMLRFLIQRNIGAIPKSVTVERLQENINVFDFFLNDDEVTALKDLDKGEPARICDFKIFTAFMSHPQWPFPR